MLFFVSCWEMNPEDCIYNLCIFLGDTRKLQLAVIRGNLRGVKEFRQRPGGARPEAQVQHRHLL